MSPASSGALEIDRYIGACLISSQQTRHKVKNFNDGRYHGRKDSWAGGMPLISFQSWRQQNADSLARLAVHTQGAPLILTNRYNHRKNRNKNFASKPQDKSVATDTVSVTSDESSGSNNSENCLPRIIKPRKRRKKDRKPPHLIRPIQDQFSDSTSPDSPNSHLMPYFFDYDYISDVSETPKLHHTFDDVEDFTIKDLNGNQTESLCQCRYCDPSGQIWDVDRSCYSPFPTTTASIFDYEKLSNYSSSMIENMSNLSLDDDSGKSSISSQRSSRDLEVSTEIVTSHNGHRDLEIKFFSSDKDDTNDKSD